MTPFSNIYERFSTKVDDYILDDMFQLSIEDYEDYIYNFFRSAIVKFSSCKQDLSDRDNETQQFNITLTDLEEEILAEKMVVEWMQKEVNNTKEMRLALSNIDWKRYAEANNLNAKSNLLEAMRENADNLETRYAYSGFFKELI